MSCCGRTIGDRRDRRRYAGFDRNTTRRTRRGPPRVPRCRRSVCSSTCCLHSLRGRRRTSRSRSWHRMPLPPSRSSSAPRQWGRSSTLLLGMLSGWADMRCHLQGIRHLRRLRRMRLLPRRRCRLWHCSMTCARRRFRCTQERAAWLSSRFFHAWRFRLGAGIAPGVSTGGHLANLASRERSATGRPERAFTGPTTIARDDLRG